MNRKISAVLAVSLLAFWGCDFTKDSASAESTTVTAPVSTVTSDGKVVDGYIKNATVCVDLNKNDTCDADEPKANSNENGEYTLEYQKTDAPIIAYGGVNTATGNSFEGILKSYSDILTPVTSIVAELIASGMDKQSAEEKVAKILNIPADSIYKDPVAEAEKNPELLKANLKIQKTLELLSPNPKQTLKSVSELIKTQDLSSLEDVVYYYPDANESVKNNVKAFLETVDSQNVTTPQAYENIVELAKEKTKEFIKDNKELNSTALKEDISRCSFNPDLDDSSYTDTPPNNGQNIPYFTVGTKPSDIEAAFNYARSKDPSVETNLTLPSEEVWNSMSQEEQALYILNKERTDRGLKPFEGVVPFNTPNSLAQVAQNYTEVLFKSNTLAHDLDGSVTERITRVIPEDKIEFIPYNESLYAEGNSFKLDPVPLIKAIYTWIYADANVASGEAWGHRAMCLMKVPDDDFGIKGAEGIIAFGMKQGEDYAMYPGFKSSVVVMNAINPSPEWSGVYKLPALCYASKLQTPFTRYTNGTIYDTNTSLTWQDINLTVDTRENGINYCQNLELGGYDDWRLPTSQELSTYYTNAIKNGVTPNLAQINSNIMVATDGFVITINGAEKYNMPAGAISHAFSDSQQGDIRCVRGGETNTTQPAGHDLIADSQKQTVEDNSTKLMWINNYRLAGRANNYYGTIYCNNLDFAGFKDWRMPHAQELSTFHKKAHEENVTLNYYTSYCIAEATIEGPSKYVIVQESDSYPDLKIGDIVSFGSTAGIRCVRDTNATQTDTIPPAIPEANTTDPDLITISSRESDYQTYNYLEFNYTCTEENNTVRCKDINVTFTGEPNTKLYKLGQQGELETLMGTLNENGELNVTFYDANMSYIKNDLRENDIHYDDQLGEFVLVDENGNISKINSLWVEFHQ